MDPLPDLSPVMLAGLTWKEAHAALRRVDCAIRRDQWCSPLVILHEGVLTLDSDGDLYAYSPFGEDAQARDWSMVPRVGENGGQVEPSIRPVGGDHP